MLKYIAKRIGLAIVTIWAVATITFFLMNMVPGGPFLSEKAISPQAQAAWRQNMAWISRFLSSILHILQTQSTGISVTA